MKILPQYESINGVGKPRLIWRADEPAYVSSENTVYSGNKIQEPSFIAHDIQGSLMVIEGENICRFIILLDVSESIPELSKGKIIEISGHTSNPDINGQKKIVSVNPAYEFDENEYKAIFFEEISYVGELSNGGETGTLKRVSSYNYDELNIVVGNYVESVHVNEDGGKETVYAKVTDVQPNYIEVDGWCDDLPTNGQSFSVRGEIVDMPRCQNLTEKFSPDQIIHNLWRKRKKVKFYGWEYECELDYSQYMKPDDIIALKKHLSARDSGSIILIPRLDSPQHQYNVYYSEPLILRWFGKFLPGYKDFKIKFKGKEPVAEIPIDADGFGFGFAMNYGHQF